MNSVSKILKIKDQLKQLLDKQKYMILASLNPKGQISTNMVAFIADRDFQKLYFITPKHTRKFTNITHNNQVSAYIDNRNNDATDIASAMGVNVCGIAQEISKSDHKIMLERFIEKMPYLKNFIYSEYNALIEIKIDFFDIVERFQEVFCIDLRIDDL